MASEMFGWELTYKLVENDIKKKDDVLVALIHWCLIKYGFKCVGSGDNKSRSDCDVESESLPRDWNSRDTYALRYIYNKELYILKGVKTEADAVFNLLRVSDLSVSIIHFKVEDAVKNLRGNIESLVPNYKDVIESVNKDLLQPVVTGKNREATTQTAQQTRNPEQREPSRPHFQDDYDDPLRIGQPRRGIDVGFDPNWDPNTDPLSVGRSDLNPFGQGGGMIYNPFGSRGGIRDPGSGIPGGIPRGSIPPGARFDPYGPPGVGPRRGPGAGPSPDHLPPPGYDDMFM